MLLLFQQKICAKKTHEHLTVCPTVQQEMTKTFLLFNLEFAADVFWNNPTLKLQHLDSLATYALNVLPVIISR